MSNVTPTSSTSGSSSSGSSTSNAVNPSSTLNEQDFLQLLVAQLENQDPMNPTDSDTFIQEQAQFSTVEGITNMESSLTSMTTQQQMSNAEGLIGMDVQYTSSAGSTQEGVVSAASDSSGAVTVQVGGVDVAPSSITEVSFPPSDTTSASSSTSGSSSGGTGTGG
jgi:flagellar basal-body rod modification protein FlgD